MDGKRFDAVTRLLGRDATRRSALGLLGGFAAAQLGFASAKDKGRKSHKARPQKGKQPGSTGAVSAQAVNCSTLGHGSNVNGCNFSGDDLAGENLSSSSMVGTRFNNTNLCGADLSSSQLKNAEFKGANLIRADLSSSGCRGTLFNDATVFCQTKMCDGKTRNDDCPAEGQVCCTDAECGAGHACRGGVCCVTDLQAAINAASPGDTIRLCAGRLIGRATINKNNLTIVGVGAGSDPTSATILDGNGAGTVLTVNLGVTGAVLRDLTVTGGRGSSLAGSSGGGIANNGALTLLGVTVTGNSAAGTAGGIFNGSSGTLILGANTHVTANTVGGGGGGIQNAGTLTMQSNSHVDNNTQTNPVDIGGGGIWNNGTMTMEPNSTASNNTAASIAGGIRCVGGVVTLQAGSQVTRNTKTGGGGAGGVWEDSGCTVNDADPGIVVSNTPNNCAPPGAVPNCVG